MSPHYQRIHHCLYSLSIFSIGYSLLNVYTHTINQTNTVPSILFKWDYHIAFIPPMIVFYSLSMVWFIGSFFMIPIKDLSRLTHKIILSVLMACVIFYYFPLQCLLMREDFDYFGINWQPLYHLLTIIDKPFNQSPSLHIVFAIIIAYSLKHKIAHYHTIYAVLFYFVTFLIAISTVFTYQHHLIDVIMGIICAVLVIVLENKLYNTYQQKIAQSIIKYLTVAILGFLLIITLPVIFDCLIIIQKTAKYFAYYWLLSFLFISYLYISQNNIKHKTLTLFFNKNNNGQLSCLTKIIFMPILVIYYLMWKVAVKYQFCQTQTMPIKFNYYNKQVSVMTTGKQTKNVLNQLNKISKNYAKIIHIDMCVELSCNIFNNADYLYCPMLDLMVFDKTQYTRILTYMTQIKQLMAQSPNDKLLIICQCAMGRSRSVAMMACLLAYFNRLDFDEITTLLNHHCPNHLAMPYLDKSVIHQLARQGK